MIHPDAEAKLAPWRGSCLTVIKDFWSYDLCSGSKVASGQHYVFQNCRLWDLDGDPGFTVYCCMNRLLLHETVSSPTGEWGGGESLCPPEGSIPRRCFWAKIKSWYCTHVRLRFLRFLGFQIAVCRCPFLFRIRVVAKAGMRFSLGEHHPKSDRLLPTGEVRDRLADR